MRRYRSRKVLTLVAVLVACTAAPTLGCRASDQARLRPVGRYAVSEVVERLEPNLSESVSVESVEMVAVRRMGPEETTHTALLVSGRTAGRSPGAVWGTLYTPSGGDAGSSEASATGDGAFRLVCDALSDGEADRPEDGTYVLHLGSELLYLDLGRGRWSETDGGPGRAVVDRRGEGTVYEQVIADGRVVWQEAP